MLVLHNARLAGDLGSGNLHFKQGMQCPIQHVKLPLWCLAQTAAGSQLSGTTWPDMKGLWKPQQIKEGFEGILNMANLD